ncbi:sensor histidine kinase [Duganella sp. sic0402]|uniref:sensor histidine kinase n=1 Tax=Duganella sp. sic0402 TaxID=2854786 RepID=UPI001C45F5B2|nr:ATP-binding protein [Duganella sp. sic0402]MBV7535810.1 sensor histidine kinase [Duganella sp. sic0402]
MKLLLRAWRLVSEPTLVRRLMVAQVMLLLLLWAGVFVVMLREGGDTPGYLNAPNISKAVMLVADNLAGQPDKQQQTLRVVDAALREDFVENDLQDIGPLMMVWQNGKLVYQTDDILNGLSGDPEVGAHTLYIQGKRYRARTFRSQDTGTKVMFVAPVEAMELFLAMNSRGYFLLPLLISLPLLPLPAWLSIRLALRPWRQVTQEVAARGPGDLTPLACRPPHRELAALVDSINALLLRVNQSAQRERSFIADAAHELRTPLAAMRVHAEALQRQTGNALQHELLDGILNSGNRAGRLVGQLLRLMRSDAPDSAPHLRLALDALLQDRLAVLSMLASRSGVELEMVAAEPLYIQGQSESLVSLIDNLVENAIKYSPPGGMVQVSIVAAGAEVVLSVRDQGPGIAPALRERVFDRFFRDPRQTQSGSGLGLAIAASVAASHHGRIHLDDAPGGGLLASVRLPRA